MSHSLAHYTAILSLMPDRVFRVNRYGENLDFKGTDEDAVHGLRREDIIGTNLRDFLAPDIAQGALDAIARALDTGAMQIFEYQVPKAWAPNQGELRDYEARLVVCGDNEVLVIERDITERKRSEIALRQSEERNRALLNAIPDLMFRIRRDGTYLDARADRRSDLAISPEEMIGKTIYDLLPPDVAQQRMYYIEQAIQTGQPQLFEYQFWVQGELRDYEARMVVSGPDEVLAIMRNITERKQAERKLQESMMRQAELYQQLQSLNANLEQQVEERTAQLQQKIQEIQDLSQLKDEFLHAVSHDLRTPIMGMRLVFQNLSRKMQTTPMGDSPDSITLSPSVLERMLQSLDRQLAMLNSLLETHSGDVQGITLHPEPLLLQDLIAAIAADLAPILLQHQATLSLHLPATLPVIQADSMQIRRIFENLITNALQHNAAGLHIQIRANAENNWIRCEVEDNGVGMTPAECESLFSRYARGTRRPTGIGLGLYLCKQIVTAHGGAIGAISTPGNGATFWFTLAISGKEKQNENNEKSHHASRRVESQLMASENRRPDGSSPPAHPEAHDS